MPVDTATRVSVTGRSGNTRLFSSVMAMIALPSVSGTWGSARNTDADRDARSTSDAGQRERRGARLDG